MFFFPCPNFLDTLSIVTVTKMPATKGQNNVVLQWDSATGTNFFLAVHCQNVNIYPLPRELSGALTSTTSSIDRVVVRVLTLVGAEGST